MNSDMTSDMGTRLTIDFAVDGRPRTERIAPNTVLLDLLRDRYGMTGVKASCERGACTTLIDGTPSASCSVFAFSVDGRALETVAGQATAGELSPVQRAFAECGGFQCGYCTPGMIMLTTALLREDPEPDDPAELTLQDWTVRRGEDTPVPLPGLVARVFGGTGYEFHGEGFFKAPLSSDAPLESPCLFWEIGWAGAEVEVDPDTGKVTVLQLVASGDVGRAVNKLLCRGQDEGAAVMGLAQAMFEEVRYEDGALLNGEALDYRVPMAEDLPERFVSITQEQGHGPGPFGAKGAGEGAMVPVAAAIANAVQDATGARVTTLPLSPERVFDALQALPRERAQPR